MSKEPKQVIVIRKDLNMRKGKIVAQGAHASMAAVLRGGEKHLDAEYSRVINITYNKDSPLGIWLEGRFTKICVSVNSEQELLDIYNKAEEAGIQCRSLIKDAGLTEFNGVPTITACCIGPDFNEKIDAITGHLPLL